MNIAPTIEIRPFLNGLCSREVDKVNNFIMGQFLNGLCSREVAVAVGSN
ncbi:MULTISPECIES: hypothetical protein [unclassified Gilliamella]